MSNSIRSLTTIERRAVAGLAAIYATRLLGLFLILPVFTLYAEGLSGYTPLLAGLALGIYGLTQACLQIPFGIASDRFGRKPVIIAGLVLFAVGSVIAALSSSIEGVLFGRALQGAGAVSAAVMALVADVTSEASRTKAMAVIGITVGASFLASLLLGPILNGIVGVPGIFWLTAVLALVGIAVLVYAVPTVTTRSSHSQSTTAAPQLFLTVLRAPQLLRLNVGIFVLHAVLTAIFVVLPGALVYLAGLPVSDHWKVYAPVMVASAAFLFPLIHLAEKKRRSRMVFVGSIFVVAISQILLSWNHDSLTAIIINLFVFFIAFNVLEASLPSLISKTAPAPVKGTAIGIYSAFQFLGAFVGGTVGGWLHGHFNITAVFIFNAVLLGIWFLIAFMAPVLNSLSTRLLRFAPRSPDAAEALTQKLAAIPGVAEVTVIAEEGVAYLKVDDRELDVQALKQCSISL